LKQRLKDIAEIQTGHFAKLLGEGDVACLQVKHFDDLGRLTSDLHGDLLSSQISERHLLKNGDVLFAAKGAKNFATVCEALELPAVASTSFFVLRVKDGGILPEFLAWSLNGSVAMSYLKALASGTSIPSISKQVLEELELTIPEVQLQKHVLQIEQLRRRERDLITQIQALKEKKVQHIITNSISQWP
jgi:hypothetical protein